MEQGFLFKRMDEFMMENGNLVKNVGKVNFTGQMDRFILENSKIMNAMEKEICFIQMERDLKGSGGMGKSMVKEIIFGRMELVIAFFIQKERSKEKDILKILM